MTRKFFHPERIPVNTHRSPGLVGPQQVAKLMPVNKIAYPEKPPPVEGRPRPAALAALIFGLMLPVTAMVPVLVFRKCL